MDKIYRPEGWTNPCKRNLSFGRPDIPDMESAFEAGANAMLRALKDATSFPQEVRDSRGKRLGILVFIPDRGEVLRDSQEAVIAVSNETQVVALNHNGGEGMR